MHAKILMVSLATIVLGGCVAGGVHVGATDASDARSQCAAQQAQQRMSPQQERRFMHACMAGYGYGSGSTESKPFTVKMPHHDQQHQ